MNVLNELVANQSFIFRQDGPPRCDSQGYSSQIQNELVANQLFIFRQDISLFPKYFFSQGVSHSQTHKQVKRRPGIETREDIHERFE